MQITFNLDSSEDRARVRKLIDDMERARQSTLSDPEELRRRVREMLQGDQYGDTRRKIVRLIAEASPGSVSKDDVYRVAAEINADRTQNLAVGGLHSSLERSWRRVGGAGVFFETSAQGFTMRHDLAVIVLEVLDEWEAQSSTRAIVKVGVRPPPVATSVQVVKQPVKLDAGAGFPSASLAAAKRDQSRRGK